MTLLSLRLQQVLCKLLDLLQRVAVCCLQGYTHPEYTVNVVMQRLQDISHGVHACAALLVLHSAAACGNAGSALHL